MEEIYRSCPEFENNDYILRMVRQEDRLDLLKVYSDKEAVSFLSIIDRDLSGGRLYQKKRMKQ